MLAFDEMKIREDLTTGMITGFVDFGQQGLDQRFAALKGECTKNKPLSERTVATHMFLSPNLLLPVSMLFWHYLMLLLQV